MTRRGRNDSTTDVSRRRLLQLGGAAGLAATAGCSGILGDDGDTDVPEYASYVTVTEAEDTDGEQAFAAYLDIAALNALPDSDQSAGGGQNDDLPEDPMLALPLSGAFLIAFLGAFTLSPLGFGSVFDDTSESDGETPVDEMLLSGSGLVLLGEFDTEALDEQLTSQNDNTLAPTLEQIDETGGYTIYGSASTESGSGNQTRYAVSAEEIFVGKQTELDRLISLAGGDRDPAHESFEKFGWLLSQAGHGDIAFSAYAPDQNLSNVGSTDENSSSGTQGGLAEFDAFESATGAASSLTFDDSGETLTAQFALTGEDFSGGAREEIESTLGNRTSDASVEFDDNRVTAEATYEKGALEES